MLFCDKFRAICSHLLKTLATQLYVIYYIISSLGEVNDEADQLRLIAKSWQLIFHLQIRQRLTADLDKSVLE